MSDQHRNESTDPSAEEKERTEQLHDGSESDSHDRQRGEDTASGGGAKE